jgi:hypothetical protein
LPSVFLAGGSESDTVFPRRAEQTLVSPYHGGRWSVIFRSLHWTTFTEEYHHLAKPNYSFEKRKRDMDKKARKAEKKQRKLEKPSSPAGTDSDQPAAEGAPAAE